MDFSYFLFPTYLFIWKKPSSILCIGLVNGKTILKSFIRINRNNKCNLQSVSEILLNFKYIKCLYVTLTYFISIYWYSRINQSITPMCSLVYDHYTKLHIVAKHDVVMLVSWLTTKHCTEQPFSHCPKQWENLNSFKYCQLANEWNYKNNKVFLAWNRNLILAR